MKDFIWKKLNGGVISKAEYQSKLKVLELDESRFQYKDVCQRL
jgi:hypothetical protein